MKKLFLAIFLTTCLFANAQLKGVVNDAVTSEPISSVSIYAKNGTQVLETATDENGKFSVDFPFQSLFFSHISYGKIEIKKENLKNIVELAPISTLLSEVVVSNKQPAWLEKKLKDFVKNKKKNYQTSEIQLDYQFNSTTLNDSSGYVFQSAGSMLVPKYAENQEYKISPTKNIIQYKDTTAGADFYQFSRVLYYDFLKSVDNQFIKNYYFNQNHQYQNSDKNIIQLLYQSKKYSDDNGYIVLDTAQNIILEFKRISGTNFNKKHILLPIVKRYAENRGYRWNVWTINIYGKFEKIGNSYYLTECKYQSHKNDSYKDNVLNAHFESDLKISKSSSYQVSKWLKLLAPYDRTIIYTKKMQQADNALQNLPKIYEKF